MRNIYFAKLEELHAQLESMTSIAKDCLVLGVNLADVNGTRGVQCQMEELLLKVEQLGSLEKDIFHSCEMLILKQQPVAQDLEFITRSIKQILDLRRVGEISYNSAKIIHNLPKECALELLTQMSKLLLDMFEGFVNGDLVRVEEIENLTDSCFKQVKEQVAIALQQSTHTPQLTHSWLEVLMLSKYFEKLADHILALAHA